MGKRKTQNRSQSSKVKGVKRNRKRSAPKRRKQSVVKRTRTGNRTRFGESRKKHKSAPLAKSTTISQDGGQRPVYRREFIQDIYSNGSSQFGQYPINIGLPEAFPWGSLVAQAYEKYKFSELSFVFVSNRPATDAGMIAILPDYDPDDDNTSLTKKELLTFAQVERGHVWDNLVCHFNPKSLNTYKDYYIRDVDNPNDMKKLFDTSQVNVYVDTPDIPINAFLGELWVQYKVQLKIPQLQRPLPRMYTIASQNAGTNPALETSRWLYDNPQVGIDDFKGAIEWLSDGRLKILRDMMFRLNVFGKSYTTIDPTSEEFDIADFSGAAPAGGSLTVTHGVSGVGYNDNLSAFAEGQLDETAYVKIEGAKPNNPAYIYGNVAFNETTNTAPLFVYDTQIVELNGKDYNRNVEWVLTRKSRTKKRTRHFRIVGKPFPKGKLNGKLYVPPFLKEKYTKFPPEIVTSKSEVVVKKVKKVEPKTTDVAPKCKEHITFDDGKTDLSKVRCPICMDPIGWNDHCKVVKTND